jgi:hypothetical protein
MANKKISGLIQRTPDGTEYFEVIIPPFSPGTNRKVLLSDLGLALGAVEHYRGDYAGTSAFPTTGGNFTAGVPAQADRWRLTNTLSIGGNIYPPGTIIEAAINAPGQTLTNWSKYAMQL